MFHRSGVFLPENPTGRTTVGNSTIESSYYGCALEPDLTVDSWYIYPGSTMTKSRATTVGTPQQGCAWLTNLGNSWCGTMQTVEGTVPGDFFAESPWLPIDPTKSGITYATVDGIGRSHDYRTIDR